MQRAEKQIRLWEMVMIASQFDFTCDEIESFNNVKFNAITPLVVNSTFACELYLKALYYITNNNLIGGHDLKKLYDRQNASIQQEIFDEYRKSWLESQIAQNVPAEHHRIIDESMFESDLNEVKDSFVDWRYGFEKTDSVTIRLSILNTLRLSLRTIIDKHYDRTA